MKRTSIQARPNVPELRYWLIAILVLALLLFPAIVESANAACIVNVQQGNDRSTIEPIEKSESTKTSPRPSSTPSPRAAGRRISMGKSNGSAIEETLLPARGGEGVQGGRGPAAEDMT